MSDTRHSDAPPDGQTAEFAREAAYLSMLYEHLDAVRDEQARRLAEVRLTAPGGTPQARTERDALARHLERRLEALDIGDLPLCFGRLDLEDGATLYIGRVGLAGEAEDPLLMDWRAPKAALFYRATAGAPEGVRRRRHLITHGRALVAIEDELFGEPGDQALESHELQGDAALLRALDRARSGHMHDIAATIQREQDAVIRSELSGALVVQGGPGTGKTAVALHRAAYLLYTYRHRLAANGVLLIGPNPVFLRYIEQVLPSLGETGAVMSSTRSLYPGVRATGHDDDTVAEVKSRPEMTALIARAITDRERSPRRGVDLLVGGRRIHVEQAMLVRARRQGQRSRRPHNEARPVVEGAILEASLSQFVAAQIDAGLPEPTPVALGLLRRELRRSSEFRVVMERMWPLLTPQQLLNDLFGAPPLVRSAALAAGIDDWQSLVRERERRPEAVAWSIEDVPLLDEAAEQLGSWTLAAERRASRRRAADQRRELDFARSVLSTIDASLNIDPELLAERFAEHESSSLAERAAGDRSWRFGHVIVDEAQELSPMTWRLVARRIPSRSMSILGDLAQCGAAWAPASWAQVLDPVASGRWRLAELTTNYRTPVEIMELANAVLAEVAPEATPTIAIRETGHRPTSRHVGAAELAEAAARCAQELLSALASGRVAVLSAAVPSEELATALQRRLGVAFDRADPLGARAALLSVADAKGLEFDAVVLLEPSEVTRRGERGWHDLYVALSRATQRLVVLHTLALPELLGAHLEALDP